MIRYITIWLFAIIGLSSCSDDESVKNGGSDNVKIVFALRMPNVALTRTNTETQIDENRIDEVDVLAFIQKGSGWVYEYTATGVEINATAGGNITTDMTVTANVREMSAQQMFIILANSREELVITAPIPGEAIENIENRLICSADKKEWPDEINGNEDFIPFPMYARTEANAINAGINNIGIFPMIRMVARIDVTLDANLDNFILDGACLFNYMTLGYVSYSKSDFSGNKANTPAVPPGGNTGTPILSAKYYYEANNEPPADTRGEVKGCIYTFESDAITTADDKTKKTALIIGGYYDGSTIKTYYRIDLKTLEDTEDTNISSGILRNYLYKVKVMSVSGPGYPTALDAYMGVCRLTAEVDPWDMAMQNVVVDGQFYLTMARDEDDMIPTDGGEVEIKAKTDYNITSQGFNSGIRASEADIVYYPAVSPGEEWITLRLSGMNGDCERTITIIASANTMRVDRTAKVYIKAGNLTQIVLVTQNGSFLHITDRNGGSIDELLFVSNNNSIGIDPEPQLFKVEWAPVVEQVEIEKIYGNNPFTWQDGLTNNLVCLNDMSGSFVFNVNPEGFTQEEIDNDPFIEKETELRFTLEGVGMDNITLRQIHYELVAETEPYYVLDGSDYTFTVKCNAGWRIKQITQTPLDASITTVLNNTPGHNLAVGTTGGNNTTGGDDISFRLITDNKELIGEVNVVFESTDGLFEDQTANLVVISTSYLSKWARSNVVWDGTKLTFAVNPADYAVIPANSQGVFFKWGSLVAISPVASSNGSSVYSNTGQIIYSPQGVYTSSWNNVPHISETSAPFDDKDKSDDNFAGYNGGTGFDESTGKGDVCRYISAKGWVDGNWRLPTASELNDLSDEGAIVYGSKGSNNNDYIQEGSVNGMPYSYGYYQISYGYMLGLGAISGDNRAWPSGGLFFPTSGYRNSIGTVGDTEWTGYSSAGSSEKKKGFCLSVGNGGVKLSSVERGVGLSVRCVRND